MPNSQTLRSCGMCAAASDKLLELYVMLLLSYAFITIEYIRQLVFYLHWTARTDAPLSLDRFNTLSS